MAKPLTVKGPPLTDEPAPDDLLMTVRQITERL